MIVRNCIVLLVLIQFILAGCSQAQDANKTEGVVKAFQHVYNGDQNGLPSFTISYRIWYRGNTSIQEIPIVNFVQDTLGKTSVTVAITHYSYINPDTETYCSFPQMSLGLKDIKYFSEIDSVLKDGALDLYSDQPFEYEKIVRMRDTLENGVEYQRYRVLKTINNINVEIESYLRCDKKGTIVTFLKSISDSLKCPIVKTNVYENGQLASVGEFEYLSNTLSSDEIRIFDLLEAGKQK